MGRRQAVKIDLESTQVAVELPAHEVGRTLSRHLLRIGDTCVDQVPAVVGRSDQNGIALTDVDDVDLQQSVESPRLLAKRTRGDPATPPAGTHLDLRPCGLHVLQGVHEISPEEVGHGLSPLVA